MGWYYLSIPKLNGGIEFLPRTDLYCNPLIFFPRMCYDFHPHNSYALSTTDIYWCVILGKERRVCKIQLLNGCYHLYLLSNSITTPDTFINALCMDKSGVDYLQSAIRTGVIKAIICHQYLQCAICIAGLILGLRPANERRRYKVTPSLIGWAHF